VPVASYKYRSCNRSLILN